MVPKMQIQKELATGQLLEIMPKARTDLHLYWHHWKQQSKQLEKLTLDLISNTQSILD
ncbi:Chromosome initiation inhibitor [compost metagenome]